MKKHIIGLIILFVVVPTIGIIFFVPMIDEFPVFNCITTPCIPPQITVYDYIIREYFPEPFQIPDCAVEAC